MKTNFLNKIPLLFYVLFFIMLLILPNLFITAEGGYVVAQIEVDPNEGPGGGSPMAEVSPGQTGTVAFTGRIVLKKYPPKNEQVFFNMWAKSESDKENDLWGASVMPKQFVMPPRTLTSDDFNIYVTAPMYEDVNEMRTVTVGGSFMLNPGWFADEVKEAKVHVRVGPYIKFVIYPLEGYRRVWPGSEADFKMVVHNLGNRNETFYIKVNNQESLTKAGFAVYFPTNTITVPPFTRGEFNFKVIGTVKYFHPWRSHMTTITLSVEPTTELPQLDAQDPSFYVQTFDFFYYEFGPSFPEPCIFGIIIAIVVLVAVYYILKKRSRKRRIQRRLFRKLLRRKKRKEQQE